MAIEKNKTKKWKEIKLGEVSRLINGFAFKSKDYVEKGILNFRVANIKSDGTLNLNNCEYLPNNFSSKYKDYLLNEDDIILVMVGATRGKLCKIPKYVLPALMNQNMWKFRIVSKEIDRGFLYFLLKWKAPSIIEEFSDSTRGFFKKDDFNSLELKIPKLSEQKVIAKTLSSVQDAITGQEDLIAKLKELKRNMMQHLFTHGTKGEKTKMTEIGEIPESWKVAELGNFLQKTKTEDPTKNPDKEFIYIDVSAVSNNFFKIISDQKLLGKDAPSRARKQIQTGDIIFATVRPTLQRIAMIPKQYNDQICSTGYCVLRVKDNIDRYFLFHYLCSDIVRRFVQGSQKGVSYPAIRDGVLFEIKLPFPDIKEQKIIGQALFAIDKKIEVANDKLLNYQNLFKTLLHEIMSGEKRIK